MTGSKTLFWRYFMKSIQILFVCLMLVALAFPGCGEQVNLSKDDVNPATRDNAADSDDEAKGDGGAASDGDEILAVANALAGTWKKGCTLLHTRSWVSALTLNADLTFEFVRSKYVEDDCSGEASGNYRVEGKFAVDGSNIDFSLIASFYTEFEGTNIAVFNGSDGLYCGYTDWELGVEKNIHNRPEVFGGLLCGVGQEVTGTKDGLTDKSIFSLSEDKNALVFGGEHLFVGMKLSTGGAREASVNPDNAFDRE